VVAHLNGRGAAGEGRIIIANVMAGLVPAIHVVIKTASPLDNDRRADLGAVVEIDDVVIGHTNAA
jgi:hypothetical protein